MMTRDVVKQNERVSWGKVFQANFKDSLNLKRTFIMFYFISDRLEMLQNSLEMFRP